MPPRCQIVAFSYDGMGSLSGTASADAGYLCWGFSIARDGVIASQAHVLARFSRKMERIARSSMACEAAAYCANADLALLFRFSRRGSIFGFFAYGATVPSDSVTSVIPFAYPESTSDYVLYSTGYRLQHALDRRSSPTDRSPSWFSRNRIRSDECSPYLDLAALRDSFSLF